MKDISFQLYSARNTSLAEALNIVATCGYSAVEAYRDNITDLELFQALLAENELRCVSIHIGRDELRDNMQRALDVSMQLGVKQIVCPYLLPQERPVDSTGWRSLADELAGYASRIKAAGLPFAWHNHDFEFVATSDGVVPMRLLLDQVVDLQWEIDLGWIQRTGEDPASWLRTYGDRVSAVHLKDLAVGPDVLGEGGLDENSLEEDGWADVGHGVIDWQEVRSALPSIDNDLFIVEHDNPSDLKRFASRSIATVESWTL